MSNVSCRPANRGLCQRVVPPALAVIALAFGLGSSQTTCAGEAFGGGVAVVPNSHIEHFAFNVKETGEGAAEGNIKFAQRGEGGIWFVSHLRANCMHFIDAQTAIVACTVVNDADPAYIGTTAIFTVRDNGHGPSAPPDEFTGVFYALDDPDIDEWTCELGLEILEGTPGLLEELLTPFGPGNLQVRP